MITDTIKYLTSMMLIVIGLGLCIGGIFFNPLLAVGGPVLAAGLSLLGITFTGKAAPTVIFRSRRSPRAAAPPENTTVPVDPPILTFTHNYHQGVDNRAPTRPNTPSDEDSMETARSSSPRMTLANR